MALYSEEISSQQEAPGPQSHRYRGYERRHLSIQVLQYPHLPPTVENDFVQHHANRFLVKYKNEGTTNIERVFLAVGFHPIADRHYALPSFP